MFAFFMVLDTDDSILDTNVTEIMDGEEITPEVMNRYIFEIVL